MVFPLPLTPFEEYMLADDRPQWPMTFFVRLTLRGHYDPAILAAALQAALARHPLLNSLLTRNDRGGLQWVAGPGALPTILHNAAPEAIDLSAGEQIDLRCEIGLRLWVHSTDSDEWTLWLQFHHACCDGLGATQFVSDLLAAYGYQLAGLNGSAECGPQVRHALDPQRLRKRGSFGLSFFRQVLRVPQELLGLLGAIEFFSHRPPSLRPAPEENAEGSHAAENIGRTMAAKDITSGTHAFPRWITRRFTTEQSQWLRERAKSYKATLNDLLLASLFLAIDDWFAEHRPTARQQFLRIMVPTNLRSAVDRETPAANIVSMVNLDRRPSRYADPQRLLKSLSLEMAVIKRCRLGITMHHLVRLARRFGKFHWLIRDDRCLSTCVLSNLGDVTEVGEFATNGGPSAEGRLELASLDFIPPIRPWTAAAFGVLTYRGQLTITLHLDREMPPGSESSLLEKFVDHLAGSLNDGTLMSAAKKAAAIAV